MSNQPQKAQNDLAAECHSAARATEDDEESEEEPTQTKKQKTLKSAAKKLKSPKQHSGTETALLNGYKSEVNNDQQSGKKNKKKSQETPQTEIPNSVKRKNKKTPSAGDTSIPQEVEMPEDSIVIQDIREGTGSAARNGQTVCVFYQGRIKATNEIFDECKCGYDPPFKFRLGEGEVIKGLDVGIRGMKAGGSRRILCSPSMAYGPQGFPPMIPPNSSLVFDIDLKGFD